MSGLIENDGRVSPLLSKLLVGQPYLPGEWIANKDGLVCH
jgi:hypothetical protein